MNRIILASGSPRRREILEQACIPFEVMVSRREEKYQGTEPADVVKELALRKAEDIAAQTGKRNVIILGADTVVAHKGNILGKPKDDKDAFDMINAIQGESHDVYTGIAVLAYDEDGRRRTVSEAVGTKVFVDSMDEEEIHAYLAAGEHRDKAGSYAIQGHFAPYVTKIEGDYYNVVGLPVSRVRRILKEMTKND